MLRDDHTAASVAAGLASTPRWARWLATAVGVAVLAIVVAADRSALPPVLKRVYAFPGGDKVGHFGLMGGLAFVAALALPGRGRRWLAAPGALLVVALVTAEEGSQALFPGRTFSLADLAASYAGIAAGAYLAARVRRPPGARRSPPAGR